MAVWECWRYEATLPSQCLSLFLMLSPQGVLWQLKMTIFQFGNWHVSYPYDLWRALNFVRMIWLVFLFYFRGYYTFPSQIITYFYILSHWVQNWAMYSSFFQIIYNVHIFLEMTLFFWDKKASVIRDDIIVIFLIMRAKWSFHFNLNLQLSSFPFLLLHWSFLSLLLGEAPSPNPHSPMKLM